MHVVIYTGALLDPYNYDARINILRSVAKLKGWTIEQVISETIFDADDASDDREYYQTYDPVFNYMYEKEIKEAIVMVTDIKCLGKNIANILEFVDQLHERGISLYVHEFNMISFENGKENASFRLLLNMMAVAIEIEANNRKERHMSGIDKARLQGKYQGRKKGAKANLEKLLAKYNDVIELIADSNFSLRQLATRTNHSVNTIRRIKKLLTKI